MERPEGAGRKPGSKNKKTILKVTETLTSREINPTERILDLIQFLEPADQLKAWTLLLSYCEAKPKEIEPESESPRGEMADQVKDVTNSVLIKFLKEQKNKPESENE